MAFELEWAAAVFAGEQIAQNVVHDRLTVAGIVAVMRSTTPPMRGILFVRGVGRLAVAGAWLLGACFSPGADIEGSATSGTATTAATSTTTTTTTTVTATGTGTTGGTANDTTTGSPTTESPMTTTGETMTTTGSTTDEPSDSTTDGTTDETSDSTGAPLGCGDGIFIPPEECDDNNDMNGDGCSATCKVEFRYVFVSSELYSGNLIGDVTGGDFKCNMLAKAQPKLVARNFAAWLSTAEVHAKDRIGDSKVPYVLVDGTMVASETSTLVKSMLDAPINLTENGTTADNTAQVWTGTKADGTAAAEHCTGWSADGEVGLTGLWMQKDGTWTHDELLPCPTTRRIYCIEKPL